MVHRTLTPSVLMESERRTHVVRDTAAFLQQHDFHLMTKEQAFSAVPWGVGDRFYIHAVGFFAVLLQLPRSKASRPGVRVGVSCSSGIRWNDVRKHGSEHEAVLDACKLAQAFAPLMCGGD